MRVVFSAAAHDTGCTSQAAWTALCVLPTRDTYCCVVVCAGAGDEPVVANPEEAEALRQQIEKVRGESS